MDTATNLAARNRHLRATAHELYLERDRLRSALQHAEHKARRLEREHCILCGLPTSGKPYCYAHRGLG